MIGHGRTVLYHRPMINLYVLKVYQSALYRGEQGGGYASPYPTDTEVTKNFVGFFEKKVLTGRKSYSKISLK